MIRVAEVQINTQETETRPESYSLKFMLKYPPNIPNIVLPVWNWG